MLVERVRPILDSRNRSSRRPFTDAELMKPHVHSRVWGWTHFGSFLSDLPAPLRYLNTMTFIGTTGTAAFDNGELATTDVRRNTTVLASTAYSDMHFYQAFDGEQDCQFADDGRLLRWGDSLTWEAQHPRYTITGRYGTFDVDLTLQATDQVSYFVKTFLYQHFSILARYRGSVSSRAERWNIDGLGTIEYGRCVTPQALMSRPVPPRLRLPIDFFTYQIVRIDAATQVLLTNVCAAGGTACLTAHIRSTTGSAEVVEQGMRFTVVSYRDTPAVDPAGRRMRVPREIEWFVPGYGTICGTVDSTLRYGHGLGYVGSYAFTGTWSGSEVAGSGYLEWVDVQPGADA